MHFDLWFVMLLNEFRREVSQAKDGLKSGLDRFLIVFTLQRMSEWPDRRLPFLYLVEDLLDII